MYRSESKFEPEHRLTAFVNKAPKTATSEIVRNAYQLNLCPLKRRSQSLQFKREHNEKGLHRPADPSVGFAMDSRIGETVESRPFVLSRHSIRFPWQIDSGADNSGCFRW